MNAVVEKLQSTNVEIVQHIPTKIRESKPLLFVHGYMQGPWVWDKFISYFVDQGYCCFTLKLNRYTGSLGRHKQRWKPVSDYVEDLQHCIEAMDESPVVIAHSMGGMILQEYLASNTLPGAVLLAAVGSKGLGAGTLRMTKCHPLAALKSNLLFDPNAMIGTPDLYRQIFYSSSFPEDELQTLHPKIEFDSYRAYMEMLLFNPSSNTIGNVKDQKIPLLVLGSPDDVVVGETEIRKTATVYDADMKLFPGMGHNMMLDTGWEQVASYLNSWLSKQGLATSI
ncbi:MAG: alpha/beta hydrolase [Pseudomonadales bacterium]|nr:alpha/beta hydrolase [Pseudomonadales bacterium]